MKAHARKQAQPQPRAPFQLRRFTQHKSGNQAATAHAHAESLKVECSVSASTSFALDFSRIPVHSKVPASVQPKLTVNASGDIYEQETFAVVNEYPEVAQALIEAGAEVNSKDKKGWTPLTYAIHSGNVGVVRLLIEAEADLSRADMNGDTILIHAVRTKISTLSVRS